MQNETIKHVSPVSGIFIKKNVVNFTYNHTTATFFLKFAYTQGLLANNYECLNLISALYVTCHSGTIH